MNNVATLLVILLLTAICAGIAGAGYRLGHNSRDDEFAALQRDLGEAIARRDNLDTTLAGLRRTLGEERTRRARAQAIATEQLAQRGERITALERAGRERQAHLINEAQADDDCAPLRDLAVCAAVAGRLFGEPAAAGAH